MSDMKTATNYEEKLDWFIGYEEDFVPFAIDEKTSVEYYRQKEEPVGSSADVLLTKRLSALLKDYEQKSSSASVWEAFFEQKKRHLRDRERSVLPDQTVANTLGNAPATLSIGSADLGAVISLFFGGLLILSAVSGAALITPLVGWIGALFGLGFFVMGLISKRRPAS